ncbi:hypothetical protein TASIC1_0004012900 [Trichoderma asperellum]|uniref:Uncharacterized protein n=1 Tax=Trichoderma asperellum TaxID=101201 RepID=A0A6V8QQ62_TRIAP|nr:hypothetical protein TASIC1_0004012900 [Trichoderma asperellum]
MRDDGPLCVLYLNQYEAYSERAAVAEGAQAANCAKGSRLTTSRICRGNVTFAAAQLIAALCLTARAEGCGLGRYAPSHDAFAAISRHFPDLTDGASRVL